MRFSKLLLTFVIGALSVTWAQSTPPQTPPPGSQTGSSAGSQKSTAPRPPQRGMEGSSEERMRMRDQHMQAMQGDLAKMRSLLDQMKSNSASMTGKDKAAMDANVQLWQMMIDHMSKMAEHMSSMQGGGGMGQMAMMAGGGCPCMKGNTAGDQGGGDMAGCCGSGGCCGGGSGMSCGMKSGAGQHPGMSHDMSGMHDQGTMQGPASAAPAPPTSNNPPTPPQQ